MQLVSIDLLREFEWTTTLTRVGTFLWKGLSATSRDTTRNSPTASYV